MVTRGQFEQLYPTNDFGRLMEQMGMYLNIAVKQFGWPSLLAGLVPLYFLLKIGKREQTVILGSFALFLCTSVFMTILLNPPPDRQATGMVMYYYSPSFLLLAIWAGFGLILLGTIIGRIKIGVKPLG